MRQALILNKQDLYNLRTVGLSFVANGEPVSLLFDSKRSAAPVFVEDNGHTNGLNGHSDRRRPMSAQARQAVSTGMKTYWANRRAGSKRGSSPMQAEARLKNLEKARAILARKRKALVKTNG